MPAHLCIVYSSFGITTAELGTTAQTLRLLSPKYLLCLKSKFADPRSIFKRDGDNAPESRGGNCILISSVTSTESPVAECSMSLAKGLHPSGLPVQLSEDIALLSKNSLCTWMKQLLCHQKHPASQSVLSHQLRSWEKRMKSWSTSGGTGQNGREKVLVMLFYLPTMRICKIAHGLN